VLSADVRLRCVSEDLTGRRLGHYRIDGVLGKGGMSVMYRATDIRESFPGAERELVFVGKHQVMGIVVDTQSFFGFDVIRILREPRKLVKAALGIRKCLGPSIGYEEA